MKFMKVFAVLILLLAVFLVVPLVQAAYPGPGPCDKIKCKNGLPCPAGYTCSVIGFGGSEGYCQKTCGWQSGGVECNQMASWCTKYEKYYPSASQTCTDGGHSGKGYECVGASNLNEGLCKYRDDGEVVQITPDGWPTQQCCNNVTINNPNAVYWWTNGLTVQQACCDSKYVPVRWQSYPWGDKDCYPKSRQIGTPDLCIVGADRGTITLPACNPPKSWDGMYTTLCNSVCKYTRDISKCVCNAPKPNSQACGKKKDNCKDKYNPQQTDSDFDGMGNACDNCPLDSLDICNPLKSVSAVMGSGGGTISTADGVAALSVPAGALGESEITLADGENSGEVILASEGIILTDYYIIPAGINFTISAILTLKYEQGNMAGCGKQEQAIDIYYNNPDTYYNNPETLEWTAQNGTVNCATNTISLQIKNLPFDDLSTISEYAVIAPLDTDNDGMLDDWKGELDNCPSVSNMNQADMDSDSIGDVCDPDADNDTVFDSVDNCQLVYNPDQVDLDGDGYGVACDPDDDGDGVLDVNDCDPLNVSIYPGAMEVCNGVDDNCDGNIDEGIVAVPTACGVGSCADTGQLTCQNGTFVDSCVAGTPTPELCDSKLNDEDCDGENNEGCKCVQGQTQNCGPETDVGECIFGIQTCNINGIWGSCIGEVMPAPEVCDGLDNDCNGAVDEGYVPTPTSCGVGACAAEGQLICMNGSEQNTCTPGTPAADDAICNGIDEDCSGIADEDYAETPTTCGVDLCSNTGKLTCVSGTTQDTCTPKPPVTVYFDSDSDVYGNGANSQAVCTIPNGYILNDGDCNDQDASVNPGANDICSVGNVIIDKDCDATNNGNLDCNDFCGDIDGDGYVTPAQWNKWNGIIPSIICPWIVDQGDCNDNDAAVHLGVADAVCNGVDDNCNGAVDEGYVPTPTSCGVGACAASGQLVCQAGTIVNTCTPGTPTSETCNGIDDDCNGVVDDADADKDGLNDCDGADKCLGSVADNIALNPNQYAQNNVLTGAFESGPRGDQSIVYNMQNTKGCTCTQIVAKLGVGIGQIKKGCAPGVMQEWTGLSGEPDRVAGIGKK